MFNDNGLGDADACPAAIGQWITGAWPVLLQHERSRAASADPEGHANRGQNWLSRIHAHMKLAVPMPASAC